MLTTLLNLNSFLRLRRPFAVMSNSVRKFTIALIQMRIKSSKSDNLQHAADLIEDAVKRGSSLIALPECFNSPYGTQYFAEYAENIPGETSDFLSGLAKRHGVFLIGGSIPERDAAKLYNTCMVFGPDGTLLAKHRKLHLFDIDVPGRITFKESSVLSAGNTFTMFETPMCKVGIGICYDMRFAELAQVYAQSGCKLLVYPGAFNMTTGPAHWELLQRARAVDNQIYVAAVSVARDESAKYIAWGHSAVASPWGDVCCKLDEKEGILYADIDLDHLENVRQQIPLTAQRRHDLYKVESLIPTGM